MAPDGPNPAAGSGPSSGITSWWGQAKRTFLEKIRSAAPYPGTYGYRSVQPRTMRQIDRGRLEQPRGRAA
ncbi:hypothetical protein VTN96DRAFT_8497 [Rasamsonia emersonii]